MKAFTYQRADTTAHAAAATAKPGAKSLPAAPICLT